MAATYMEFLEDEGMAPSLDASGAVIFESRGRSYYLIVDDDDPQYFRLLYPNFWSLDGAEERQRALLALGRAEEAYGLLGALRSQQALTVEQLAALEAPIASQMLSER